MSDWYYDRPEGNLRMSRCRKCQKYIPSKTARFGRHARFMSYDTTFYYHIECGVELIKAEISELQALLDTTTDIAMQEVLRDLK